jgi:hypothetical protein
MTAAPRDGRYVVKARSHRMRVFEPSVDAMPAYSATPSVPLEYLDIIKPLGRQRC